MQLIWSWRKTDAMDVHRKFTFDNPEDDYWNQSNNDANGFFFEDPKEAVSAARQALDNLAESRDQFSGSAALTDDSASIADSDKPMSECDFEVSSRLSVTSTPARKPDFSMSDSGSVIGDSRFNGAFTKPVFSSASIMSDCSIGSFHSDATVHLDYSRLKSEHRKLQKHLEHVRNERYSCAPAAETMKRLCDGQPVTLDLYRSKQEKVELLDGAIGTLDHDVVVRIVLFLKRTLSNTMFREILIFKPFAADCYIAYLREAGEYEELIDSLFAIGKSDEAAMVEFSLACKKRQSDAKVQALKKCLVSGFSSPTLSLEGGYVRDYINLLEHQIPVDSTDDVVAKSGKDELFNQFPKRASLIGQPLLTTLYYCCLYHYDLPKNSYASPLSVREFFGISEREFNWMAISALARLKRYDDIEKLMTSKKLLAAAKIVCPFSWFAFFTLIFKYGVPPKEYLNRWLRSIPDLEERLRVCESTTEARDVQIETLIALKDRVKLTALITKMTPHTNESNKAHIALANTAYKWKN